MKIIKPDLHNTYINPTPLPDYPIGRNGLKDELNWRETADPTVLYEGGKWYLYPSCGMAWVSEDFCTWKHVEIEPADCGYAPTVVKHKGKFLLCACLSDIYESDSPLGPFVSTGKFHFENGEELKNCFDPMLFSDDDGRLYLYYCTGDYLTGGTIILGCELDSDNPSLVITEPVELIVFHSDREWECNGEHNEDKSSSSLEGAWMYKKNGIYYLTYCGPGTEYSTYAMGAYKSTEGPLSGFEYMKTNPFIKKNYGVVRGPGHGCVVDGPNDTVFVFYTCTLCYMYLFERRIGYDRLIIDENGDLICPVVTETPQLSPLVTDAELPELKCLTATRKAAASSCAPGRDAIYSTSEDLLSWWQPAENDPEPSLRVSLPLNGAFCSAVRIIWRDIGLSLKNGALPGPIKYKIEIKTDKYEEKWTEVVDRTDSDEDFIIDYRTFDSIFGYELRLTVTEAPAGISPGVINFSVFGYTEAGKR